MTITRFHHESIYRGQEALHVLRGAPVHIMGAGAIGSHLAVNLSRMGMSNLHVIDRDRVEEHNVGTQVYSLEDVGGLKADILRNLVFRETGEDLKCHSREVTSRNVAKFLKGASLVVDCFDNTESRRLITNYCHGSGIACLHAGVNGDYGEVIWNEVYRVPGGADGEENACDYPLARNLILLVVAVACEVLVRYILTGERNNHTITLGDLTINHETDLAIGSSD